MDYYVDDGVSVQQPHDSRLGVAGDATTESGAFTLVDHLGLGLGDEARLESLLFRFDKFGSALPSCGIFFKIKIYNRDDIARDLHSYPIPFDESFRYWPCLSAIENRR